MVLAVDNHQFGVGAAWLGVATMAIDLIAWTKLMTFHGDPARARCEIAAFRYRVLHVAARITPPSQTDVPTNDRTWRWATAVVAGWHQIRTAFS